jgi:hypothetical protein
MPLPGYSCDGGSPLTKSQWPGGPPRKPKDVSPKERAAPLGLLGGEV